MPKSIATIQNEIEGQAGLLAQELGALRARLMPGIYRNLETTYQDDILNQLTAAISTTPDDLDATVAAFKRILADNWTLVQGTSLCYTNNPDDAITKLLCDVAEFIVAEESEENIPHRGVLSVLMPTVCIDSINPHYPDLAPSHTNDWQDIDIQNALKTHILGREGKYLIPVTLITTYDASVGLPTIVNPYYDFSEQTEDMVKLNDEEINRLIEHSPLTRAIYDAKTAYETAANPQTNLLGHIRHLISQLEYNSVNGIGGEESAGNGAYLAIFNFFTYYNRLGVDELALVPAAVNGALRQIEEYASNPNTHGSIGSCLATRRMELKGAIVGQDELLSTIGLNGEAQQNLVTEASAQLTAARQSLQQRVASAEYIGKDALGLTLALLRRYELELPFNNYTDVNILKTLSVAEIEAVCSDAQYRPRIVTAIASIENLVVLSVELSPKKLQALLRSMGPQLAQQYFNNDGAGFAMTLLSLDQERRDIYWHQYKNSLPLLIKNGQNFAKICAVLTPAQRAELYAIVNPIELTKCTSDFVGILKFVTAETRRDVFEKLRLHKSKALQSPLTLMIATSERARGNETNFVVS